MSNAHAMPSTVKRSVLEDAAQSLASAGTSRRHAGIARLLSSPILQSVLWCIAILCVGCNKTSEFADVTGKVTIDGAPAPGVQVAFEPQSQDPRKILAAAYGMTDANGAYRLLRRGREPGAPVGLHHVRMTPVEQDGGKLAVIHPRYQANNAIWAEVKPGPNVIDFDLQSGRNPASKAPAAAPAE